MNLKSLHHQLIKPKDILSKVSQEDLMLKYTGIDKITNYPFRSPFRDDRNPSCGFFYSDSGELIFHDFSGKFSGNWIKVAAKRFNLTDRGELTKEAYHLTLYNVYNEIDFIPKIALKKPSIKKTRKLNYKNREWDVYDYEYWSQYHLDYNLGTFPLLDEYDIIPADKIFINDLYYPEYSNKKSNPTYVYDINSHTKKIYKPNDPVYKWNTFINQGRPVEGEKQLNPNYNHIWTSSLKDAVNIVNVARKANLPIDAYAYSSEHVTSEIYPNTKLYLGDNDKTGREMANRVKEKHGVETIHPRTKDFSDLVKDNFNEAVTFLENLNIK